jgi:hypothetical protein
MGWRTGSYFCVFGNSRSRLPYAFGFRIEQNPDLMLKRIQTDPWIAFRKGRELGFTKVDRFLQPGTGDLTSGTDLAPNAHLQREAAGRDGMLSGTERLDGIT